MERLKIDGAGCYDVIGNASLSLVFPTHFANKGLFLYNQRKIVCVILRNNMSEATLNMLNLYTSQKYQSY